jgi:hypothetical protein
VSEPTPVPRRREGKQIVKKTCLTRSPMVTVPPNLKHQGMFLKIQREAREAGRGLWR